MDDWQCALCGNGWPAAPTCTACGADVCYRTTAADQERAHTAAALRREDRAVQAADDLRRQRDELRAALAKAGGLLAGIYDDVMADTPITYPGEVGDLHDEIEAALARCT